jgi:putative holliday junction resolvase
MKFLGIDYGTKRVGVAISDESGKLAFPKKVLKNNLKIFTELAKLIKTENISEIVVGESTDLKNQKNKISEDIENFILVLKKEFKLLVHKQKEFFTSVEAQMKEGKEKNNARKIKKLKKEKNDAEAAALILQRYLDRINRTL